MTLAHGSWKKKEKKKKERKEKKSPHSITNPPLFHFLYKHKMSFVDKIT